MRKLIRQTGPDILEKKGEAGDTETSDAIEFFSHKNKQAGKSFEYHVYANDKVKSAVSEVSSNKCAYCEIETRAGYDGDIEHFRPKGEVTEDGGVSIKPGYYWMGAKWENLFLSCQHCNQSRKQPQVDGKIITMGKKNQFPLTDGRKRVRVHTKDISEEEPYRLLIDPCIENPLDYLDFSEDGIVSARIYKDGTADLKGQASIYVFALQRKLLKEAREKRAIIVMNALKTYEDNVRELNKYINVFPEEAIEEKKQNLSAEIQRLKAFVKKDQPFSAMAYCLIKKFLSKMNIDFNDADIM